MKEHAYNNQYRFTILCIDAYENEVLNGRMYNPYFNEGVCFKSTIDLLKKLNCMLNEMNWPQSFVEDRVFQTVQDVELKAPESVIPKKGRKATFILRVMFRQNTSWQGVVTWSEGRKEERFRSTMELLLLLDSALGE